MWIEGDEHAINFAPTLTRKMALRAPPRQRGDIGRAIRRCGELLRVTKYGKNAVFRGHYASARWPPGRLWLSTMHRRWPT